MRPLGRQVASDAWLARQHDCFEGPLLPTAAEAQAILDLAGSDPRHLIWICDGPRTLEECLRNIVALAGPDDRDLEVFPASGIEGTATDADALGERIALLERVADSDAPLIIITCIQALLQPSLSPERIASERTVLTVGQVHEREDLVDALVEQGFEPMPEVMNRREISVRGSIVDVWPSTEPWPLRLEFFGDELESARSFDPGTQQSIEHLESVAFSTQNTSGQGEMHGSTSLLHHLGDTARTYWTDLALVRHQGALYLERVHETGATRPGYDLDDLLEWVRPNGAVLTDSEGEFDEERSDWPELSSLRSVYDLPGDILAPDIMEQARKRLLDELDAHQSDGLATHIFFESDTARQRHVEWTKRQRRPAHETHVGHLSEGFLAPTIGLCVVAESDLFGPRRQTADRYRHRRDGAAAQSQGARVDDLGSLEVGDLVVHIDHGIGRYQGVQYIEVDGVRREVVAVEYAEGARVCIPVPQVHLLSRYSGVGKRNVRLHKLGGKRWQKEREAAEDAVQDLAAELLQTQAARDALKGFAYPADSTWQHEMEAAFPYRETPDQETSIAAVREDLERVRPMDRLICGDAGYGKTEVAVRAAFKVVMSHKQVALLVPTTVLAQQHFNTFRERMAAYPVRIEMLSRFVTASRRIAILNALHEGTIDIVIGTHGLLQHNVHFKDLGLVIVDEEQRFGVKHKEKLKKMRMMVDVLTMTATPIPRTLYMGLTGARDLSTIQTPPQDRTPVKTIVTEFKDELIRDAMMRELNREGQTFFIHNRVNSILTMQNYLQELIPEARIAVGHGQMRAKDLAQVMRAFVEGDIDVLLCTTIVESGVDVPNANTIIIDRADRFGLAELYQLRGRVGRSNVRAYAYMLTPKHGYIDMTARKRMSAVKTHSRPGSGFHLAMRDLEIRGAGNLLGAQQSGHIAAVGFGLYCQLLQHTVRKMKGEALPPVVDVQIRFGFVNTSPYGDEGDGARIDGTYIADDGGRIAMYRRVAELVTDDEVEQLEVELRDRFGPLPQALANLLTISRIRIAAAGKGITEIEARDDRIMMSREGKYVMRNGKFPRLRAEDTPTRLQEILAAARGV